MLDSEPSTMKTNHKHNLLAHRMTVEFKEVNVAVTICLSSLQSASTRVRDHLVVLTDGNVLHDTTLVAEHKSEEFLRSNVEGTLADSI